MCFNIKKDYLNYSNLLQLWQDKKIYFTQLDFTCDTDWINIDAKFIYINIKTK